MMEYSLKNLMAQASSPYLRQHKDNPVHWQPWGDDAFAAARALNRPILLSIGYAACHWCHVMAHESFDNPAIARLINARFVAIKLDREERPDLDSLYQHALALMGKAGGWPLTMFLTPQGVPFWGGTYFPPLPRYNMPGFADVLAGIAESYDHEPDAVAANVASLTQALTAKTAFDPAPLLTPEIVTRTAAHVLLESDAQHGGLGGAPKFPQLTKLRLLFDHGLRSRDARYGDAVLHALVQMCRGGLYDHIGGGFHRYCVDAHWLVPHFEKMLDDQTQFIHLLADVLSHHPHPVLQQALEDTIACVVRDMRDDTTGLFISSLDADSDDGEGAFYQWSHTDILQQLGDHAALFCATYDIQAQGNWDDPHHGGGNIPNRLSSSVVLAEKDEATLRAMRKKLLYHRNTRGQPARDDKILTDLNARMVTALATAGHRLARPEWLALARDCFLALTQVSVAPDDQVRHVAHDETSVCLLEDGAQLALAALALATTSTRTDDRALFMGWARRLLRPLCRDFITDNGMPRAIAAQHQDSFTSLPPIYDTPAPATAGALLRAVHTIALTDHDPAMAETAHQLATALSAPARAEFGMMASTLSALQFYQNPIIIHAGTDWQDTLRAYIPDSLCLPADTRTLSVCIGQRCLAPVHTGADVSIAIDEALAAALHKPANA